MLSQPAMIAKYLNVYSIVGSCASKPVRPLMTCMHAACHLLIGYFS